MRSKKIQGQQGSALKSIERAEKLLLRLADSSNPIK
jgi:hypothetical protein